MTSVVPGTIGTPAACISSRARVLEPIASIAGTTRIAISPRLATRTFLNIGAQPYGVSMLVACPCNTIQATIGAMPEPPRHDQAEARFRALLEEAGMPPPSEIAHLRRCLI